MKDDFMNTLIPYYAEIIADDIPDQTRELRFLALQKLQSSLSHYQRLGYIAASKGKFPYIATIFL